MSLCRLWLSWQEERTREAKSRAESAERKLQDALDELERYDEHNMKFSCLLIRETILPIKGTVLTHRMRGSYRSNEGGSVQTALPHRLNLCCPCPPLSLLLDSLRGEAAGLCNSQREMEGSVTDEAQRRRRAEETVAALQAKIEVGTPFRSPLLC